MNDLKIKNPTALNLKQSTWDFINQELETIVISECEYFSIMIEGIFEAQRKGRK